HILANANCERGLGHFLTNECALAEAVTSTECGVDILGSTWSMPLLIDSDVRAIAGLVESIRREATDYDFVLFDHGSGVSEASIVIAHGSDLNLIVMVPELTSIADAYGLFRRLIETNSNIDCRLLLNRIESDEEAFGLFDKFTAMTEQFLRQKPAMFGHLAETELFRRALAAQRPAAVVAAESPAVHTLTSLARMIAGKPELTAPVIPDQSHYEVNGLTATADIKE
ncbi:MAG TPA: hypothetical protein VLA12_09855, partial [Planctomycetaceae bacterium]|nr:hypothetical protein [Planctomycetaceae bacterium]